MTDRKFLPDVPDGFRPDDMNQRDAGRPLDALFFLDALGELSDDTRCELDRLVTPPEVSRGSLLTAYALGELPDEVATEIEKLLATPGTEEARRMVRETRAIAAALRGTPQPHETPSADLRRAVIARLAQASEPEPLVAQPAAADRGTSPPPQAPPRRRTTWLALSGALAASLLVGLVTLRPLDVAVTRRDRDAGQRERRSTAADRAAETRADARTAPMNEKQQSMSSVAVAARPPSPTAGGPGTGDALARSIASAPAHAARAVDGAAPLVANRQEQADASTLRARMVAPPAAASTDLAAALPQSRELEFGERLVEQERRRGQPTGERYARFAENRFRATAEAPLSTFSIDVDTASYALVRRFLSHGRLPHPDAVRIEELLNYFSYADPAPAGDEPFSVTVEAATCPWRPGHRLVRIGLRGREIPRAERPAGNLVFLVDVSGSMRDDDKLPLVKQGLTMLVEELDENDRVSIVTYAGEAGLRLPPTSGADKGTIIAAIESLTSGGGTHGSAGIELAYAQAAEHFVPGGANRVILATDGDLNVGVTDDAALVALIQAKASGGTFLTILGVGRGNLQDEKLEKLAAHGNGIYAYLDGAREARKVLVEQLTGSTITIAKDVKIQVEFNPGVVESWRLIGYENRLMAARDFRDDTKDAGDIGAGHAVTALYEVALVGEADDQSGGEPLRYRPRSGPPVPGPAPPASAELLTVKLRFKQPDGDTSALREVPLAARGGAFAEASADLRFAASVAAFGMLLRGSEHAGDATFGWVAATAAKALGTDAGGWRTEFLDLVRRAESLSGRDGPPGVTPAPEPVPLPR